MGPLLRVIQEAKFSARGDVYIVDTNPLKCLIKYVAWVPCVSES